MKHNKTYFISDLHLGANYINDSRGHEKKIVDMLESLGEDASHVYLLGDVLDYWFEYRTVVPRGYVRFFGALAKLVDSGVKITWIIGNHDIWLFDYLRNEIGIEIVDGSLTREIEGSVFYLAHGDGLGNLLKPSFRFIRSLFRNHICQKLYSSIHPRWTIPFAKKWSSKSRSDKGHLYADWRGDESEPSYIFAQDYLKNIDSTINYFVMGHRHLSIDRQLSPSCRFIILGECYESFIYAVFDGKNLELKQFDGKHS